MGKLLLAAFLLCFSCVTGSGASPDETLIEKVRGIHERVLTLDTHKDISAALATSRSGDDERAREAYRKRFDPTVRGSNQVDFPKSREGGYDCAFYVVYVGQGRVDGGGFVQAKRQALLKFNAIHRMAEKYPEHIEIAYTPDDVRRIHASGRLVACIGIENGYPMGDDIALIKRFKELGAGYMGITHTGHNQLGDSSSPGWYATEDEPERVMHGGLSELGREAVAEINRQGIMVDISHAGKQTMLEILEVSQAPVIASHSSVYALRDHNRNLDDEQLLALKENGGVMQTVALGNYVKDPAPRREAIVALREEMGLPADGGRGGRGGRGGGGGRRGGVAAEQPELTDEDRAEREALQAEFERRVAEEIDPEFPPANVEDFVDHIDYAVNLIGIDHVGISSDFDGGGGIDGWDNATETFNVTHELVKRGYTEEEIAKIWSGNLLRVWREVEEVAQRIQAEEGR